MKISLGSAKNDKFRFWERVPYSALIKVYSMADTKVQLVVKFGISYKVKRKSVFVALCCTAYPFFFVGATKHQVKTI